MNANVIIIGGGPAGLFTAIQSSKKNKKVIILEKNSTPGKKLLITGSGQCNLTQAGNIKQFFNHYGENDKFIRSSLYGFNNKDLINFFKKRGVDFSTTDQGKIFPASYQAKDILNVLLQACSEKNIIIKYSEPVQQIKFSQDSKNFISKTNKNEYVSEYLVLATGGQSYTVTGSSGDGYQFAKSLGHTINQPKPSLTPLYIENYQFSDLAGISLSEVGISLWRKGSLLKRWSGDLLFTHKGLSGPGILNYSRYIDAGDTIKLKLIDAKNEAILDNDLANKIELNGKLLFKNLLKELPLPYRLTSKIIETASIENDKISAQVTKAERKKVAKLLFALPLTVERLGGFNVAMVTKGGISLKEIDPKTMESSILANFFAVGEVLDLDGDTGGYNLQAAFSTGYMAGQAIKARI